MTRGARRAVYGLLVVGLAAGAYGYSRHRARSRFQAPVFVAAPPGPRAPSTDLLGLRIGSSRRRDAQVALSGWGLACADRSMRALMNELRDKKRAELQRAEANGAADAVTGASILTHRSARDDNPQVRLSCEDTPSEKLRDRARSPSRGRVLLVFDDEDAPLRHVSYQRSHATWNVALADYAATRDALAARFGASRETGAPVNADPPLPKYAEHTAHFRFADFEAKVTVANLGGRGYSVAESAEVPWPIRADAPGQ